ncbi:MAG: helix-turn-helix domain-containing protein [Chloroflexota bacterium]|nr:helix-turn-helix domain-containing protein [Chloroflexota bacterium]
MESDTIPFGRLLRRYRMAAGLTQEELAERAGLSTRAVSDLERGLKTVPRRDTVTMLAQALALSDGELRVLEGSVPRRRGPALEVVPRLDLLHDLIDGSGRGDVPINLLDDWLLAEPELAMSGSSSRELADRLRGWIDRLTPRAAEPEVARILARLWAHRGIALGGLGFSEEALSSVESGRLMLATAEASAESALLLLVESAIFGGYGRPYVALAKAEEAEGLANSLDKPALVAWSTSIQAHVYQQLGQIDRAIELARRSLALYESLGAWNHASRVRGVLALGVWYAGRFREAEGLQRRNLTEAQALGDRNREVYMLCGLGASLRAQGRLDEAEQHLLQARALAGQIQEHYISLSIEYHLANLWADRGDGLLDTTALEVIHARDEAIVRFERAMDHARQSRDSYMLLFSALDLAVNLAHWGDTDGPISLIEMAARTMADIGEAAAVQAWMLLSQSEVAAMEGDWELAACVEQAIPLFEAASPGGLAQAHRVAANVATAQGDLERARTHWTASLGSAKVHGQRLEELRTRRQMRLAGL